MQKCCTIGQIIFVLRATSKFELTFKEGPEIGGEILLRCLVPDCAFSAVCRHRTECRAASYKHYRQRHLVSFIYSIHQRVVVLNRKFKHRSSRRRPTSAGSPGAATRAGGARTSGSTCSTTTTSPRTSASPAQREDSYMTSNRRTRKEVQ